MKFHTSEENSYVGLSQQIGPSLLAEKWVLLQNSPGILYARKSPFTLLSLSIYITITIRHLVTFFLPFDKILALPIINIFFIECFYFPDVLYVFF